MTDEFELSRRKALAGLATIGAAGAGAGLGTSALFSDEESFEGNTITAGTLDMSVTASVEAASEYWDEEYDLPLSRTADDEGATAGVTIDDVKPGDWGIFCFDISVGDNPGYVRVSTGDYSSEDGDEDGGLDEAILATVWHSSEEGSISERGDLQGFDSTTDNNSSEGVHEVSWDPDRDEDGVTSAGDFHYTTLQEAHENEYSDGVTLGGLEEPIQVGSDDESAEFCLLLEIPTEVGNEIQGDSVEFDLIFEAEQARNNDDPFSGNESSG